MENPEDCPVNSVKIAKAGKTTGDYEIRDLEDGWELAFSKGEPDKLPIEDVKLTEGAPCINPDEIDITKGRYIYPLSRMIVNDTYKHHGCQDSINGDMNKDPRYTKIDQIDEETLYKDNGIWLKVKDLPNNQMEYVSASYFYGLFLKSALEYDLS